MGSFTLAEGAPRSGNRSGRFLKTATATTLHIDGVAVTGARGRWAIDGTPFKVTVADSKPIYWWLHGESIDPTEVADPHDAIAVLRKRDLIPGPPAAVDGQPATALTDRILEALRAAPWGLTVSDLHARLTPDGHNPTRIHLYVTLTGLEADGRVTASPFVECTRVWKAA